MMLSYSSIDDLSCLSFLTFHLCTFFDFYCALLPSQHWEGKESAFSSDILWRDLFYIPSQSVHFDLWYVCLLFPSFCSPLQWSDQLILNHGALNCSLAKTPATSSRYVSSYLDVTVANVPMCAGVVSFPWFWFHFTLQKAAISTHFRHFHRLW